MVNELITHEFLAIDEGHATLLHIDERDKAANWIVPVGHPEARDMQLIGNGRVLIGHLHGYTEFDIRLGRAVKEFAALEGVTAVRLIRQTNDGTYLMSCNDRIREGSPDGSYLRDFPVDGFYHAWKALRLPNGHLIVTAGYGAFVVELDANGRVVRRFGGKESVAESVHPFFYATFQLLPNGNLVLANWQGHGAGKGNCGEQLLEFNPAGKIVWSWSQAEMISSLQGVLVLDGLDTAKLHDERDGVMKPVTQGR